MWVEKGILVIYPMKRKLFTGLSSDAYEHPFDRKALVSLEKMPGIALLFLPGMDMTYEVLFKY